MLKKFIFQNQVPIFFFKPFSAVQNQAALAVHKELPVAPRMDCAATPATLCM